MLVGGPDEGVDVAQDAVVQRLAGSVVVFFQQAREPRLAEQVVLLVHRLGHPVGEQHRHVARPHRQMVLLEQLGELPFVPVESEHETVGRQHARHAPAAVPRGVDQRRMAGPRIGQRALFQIDHGVEHRDEAAAVERPRHDAVGLDEELPRRFVDVAQAEHEPLELGHVQRGGSALARNVRDQQPQPALAERYEVVVVAPHLPGRPADRGHRQSRNRRGVARQQRHLDLPGEAQFVLETLLFGRLVQQALHAGGHRVERFRQVAQLVLRRDADPPGEVAAADPIRPDGQRVNRSGDRPRQREPHHERRELDDQEQPAEDGQQHQEDDVRLPGADPVPEKPLHERGGRHADEHVDGLLRTGGPVDGIEKHDPGQSAGRRQPGRVQRIVRRKRPPRIEIDAGGGLDALPHLAVQRHVDYDGAGVRPVHPRDRANGRRPPRPERHESLEPVPADPPGHALRPRPAAPGAGGGEHAGFGGAEHQRRGARVVPAQRRRQRLERRRGLHAARQPRPDRRRRHPHVGDHPLDLPAHRLGARGKRRHRTRHGEEGRHQQDGDDADEDVREDQLAADAPEQAPPEPRDRLQQQVAETDGERQRSAGVQPRERRPAAADEGKQQDLRERPGQEKPPRPRPRQGPGKRSQPISSHPSLPES